MERLLILDDEKTTRDTLRTSLQQLGYEIKTENDGQKGIEAIHSFKPDVIISDVKMPNLSGIDVLKHAKEVDHGIQVILISGQDDMNAIINAMQLGAFDYMEKPIGIKELRHIVNAAFENRKISQRMAFSISVENGDEDQLTVIGSSIGMKEIFKKIGKIAANRTSILIEGESGTGKDLITKLIHDKGVTKDQPFIAVNCAAIPESLIESELFGHVKGAFTGAVRDKKGKFELAGHGTVFLDEVSEISRNLQVKLLRVLQEKEFEKVGGEHSLHMNARIVAATNRNLKRLVDEGEFREDLYFRLNVFKIEIPPLRARREDIPKLVTHLLRKINKDVNKTVNKVPFEVMERLKTHDWPGNVRELENTLLQAVLLSKGDTLEMDDISLSSQKIESSILDVNMNNKALHEIERIHIQQVLDSVNWEKKKACDILGITHPTLNKKIKIYKLNQPS